MAKRALCVGINKFANYPQFALNGCINDAKDMARCARPCSASRAPKSRC